MADQPARDAEDVAPTKWRKRPVVIEAMRLTWDNRRDVAHWCGGEVEPGRRVSVGLVTIPTLEGRMSADEGDWIIKGVAGEFYPCKPTIFAATYERHNDGEDCVS